jgi:hypothetical protein
MNHASSKSDHSNVGTLLARLDKVKSKGSHSWVACCPAHQDKDPSLSIKELNDGRVLIHCFSGCAPLDVLSAVGLDWDTLFPEESNYHSIIRSHNLRPRTVDDYVVDLAKNTTAPLSNQDRKRTKQAVLNGGEAFGWVDHVRKQATPTEKQP